MSQTLAPRTGYFRFASYVLEKEVGQLVRAEGWKLWLANEDGQRARNIQLYASDPNRLLYVVVTRQMIPRVFNSPDGIDGWLGRYLPGAAFFTMPAKGQDNHVFVPFPQGGAVAGLDPQNAELISIPEVS